MQTCVQRAGTHLLQLPLSLTKSCTDGGVDGSSLRGLWRRTGGRRQLVVAVDRQLRDVAELAERQLVVLVQVKPEKCTVKGVDVA